MSEHIKHIFEDGELMEDAVVRKFRTTAADGKTYNVTYYNLDIYATAVDYDPRSDMSVEFFKIVQNKLHFAAHGHTAAEVIYHRADADKPVMGLTSFKGDPLLQGAGSVSHHQAMEKAEKEYRKWEVKTLSPVEEAYLATIKMLNDKGKNKK